MYQRLLFCLIMLLSTTPSFAMHTQPIRSNHEKTIITSDGEKHTINAKTLVDCNMITAQFEWEPNLTTVSLPGLSAQEWQVFQECIEEKYTFDTAQSEELKQSLPEKTRQRLKDKKRLRDVLTAANYLDHPVLADTAMTIWSDKQFDAEGEFELPLELELGIAAKTVKSTPLDAKLPIWVAQGTKTPARVINTNKTIWSCCINNPHTKTAVGAHDGTITILDAATNESLCWQAHTREVSDLHFNADGTALFSVAQDGCVKIWDALNQFILKAQLETETVNYPLTVQLNPQQTHLATDNAHSLDIWDLATGTRRSLIDNELDTQIVAFNQTGSLIATGCTHGGLKLWDVATGTCIQTIPTPGTRVNQLRFNASANQLIAGGKSGILFIWNLTDYSLVTTIPAHTDRIWGLVLTPCSRFLFSCSADRYLKMWDLVTLKCIKSIKQPKAINDMRLTPELELLTGCHDKKLRFIPLKKLLERYQERKEYFNRNITIEQANFIRKAFEAQADEPIELATEKSLALFDQFPPEIGAMLIKELPIKIVKPTKKKRKTNESDDEDFEPE